MDLLECSGVVTVRVYSVVRVSREGGSGQDRELPREKHSSRSHGTQTQRCSALRLSSLVVV